MAEVKPLLAVPWPASLAMIRTTRDRLGHRCWAKDVPALVWDPALVRAALDEKSGRQPVVAMAARMAEASE